MAKPPTTLQDVAYDIAKWKLFPMNLSPVYFWFTLFFLLAVFFVYLMFKTRSGEQYFSQDEMDYYFFDLPDYGGNWISVNGEIYKDPDGRIFLVEKMEDEGEKWYVFTPVRRGFLRLYDVLPRLIGSIALAIFVGMFVYVV
jgi:hypothetical protein